MTKDEFVAKWSDELNGLLLASFAEEEAFTKAGKDFCDDKRMATQGRFMKLMLRRGLDLLHRIHTDLNPPKEPTNGNHKGPGPTPGIAPKEAAPLSRQKANGTH